MSSRPPGQQPFGRVERALFRVFVNCHLQISHPRQLYQSYALTYEQLALIAGCSLATMERWMSQNREPVAVKAVYLRRLGEFHFLLNNYHQIPEDLWDLICPLPPNLRRLLYPQQSEPE
jgi:hypothetical protein